MSLRRRTVRSVTQLSDEAAAEIARTAARARHGVYRWTRVARFVDLAVFVFCLWRVFAGGGTGWIVGAVIAGLATALDWWGYRSARPARRNVRRRA